MSDNSIDDIIRMAGEHLRALLLKAYEAGRVDGEASAKQKVLNLFGTSASIPRAETATAQAQTAGNVARPLLEVIQRMPIGIDGVGSNDVLKFANQQHGRKLDIWQVRSGMKTLEKRGDIVRVARGRYQLKDHHSERAGDAESEAPNSSELFGAPKPNGAEPLYQ
jgi:hypothetical protein